MSLERFRLDGAAVVITGGGGLLGRTHAAAVAEIGVLPVIIDIDESRAKSVADFVASYMASLPWFFQTTSRTNKR